jgi:hypothetical protein
VDPSRRDLILGRLFRIPEPERSPAASEEVPLAETLVYGAEETCATLSAEQPQDESLPPWMMTDEHGAA